LCGQKECFDYSPACDKKANISGFDPSQGKVKGLDLVSADLAYDEPTMGKIIILMIHQAVHVPGMENDLLCPLQMNMNNAKVKDCPKFHKANSIGASHAI
jgi:hypothetical protein